MSTGPYAGAETLEALDGAANYQQWLTGFIEELTVRAGSRTLVDFGAGIGTYARCARSLGCRVVCIELDDDQRARLTAEGFESVQALDHLSPASAPAIYTFNVLEHIPTDGRALRDLRKVTTPGGHLLVVVPAFPVLFSNLDRQVGHQRRYRRRPLMELLASAGWVVDRCDYGDALGFPAALAYRMLGRFVDGVLTPGQVGPYDRWLFPLSRRLDRVCHRLVGKNLIVFAHRPAND